MHRGEKEDTFNVLLTLKICPLGLVSSGILRNPLNLRPTSELFSGGGHMLAIAKFGGYHHLGLCCSFLCPFTPSVSMTYFMLLSSSQGCAPIRHRELQHLEIGDFQRLTRVSPEKKQSYSLQNTVYQKIPSKLK